MKKELMQQALAALNESIDCVRTEYAVYVENYCFNFSWKERLDVMKSGIDKHEAAIAALEAAIAQPVRPLSENFNRALIKHEGNCCMFERGVQTLDDLFLSRAAFIKSAQPAPLADHIGDAGKLVPLIPTPEMLAAVAKLDYESPNDVSWCDGYSVMLKAAPSMTIAQPVQQQGAA